MSFFQLFRGLHGRRSKFDLYPTSRQFSINQLFIQMKSIVIAFVIIGLVSSLHHETQDQESSSDERQYRHRKAHARPQDQRKDKINLISVIGGPGTGKGTQCAFLKESFGFKHISLGDLFRQELANKGPIATQLKAYMDEGKLVPSEIGIKLLTNEISKLRPGETALLDGFPRNQQNIDTWNRVNGDKFKLQTHLYFDCPLEVMESRLLQRSKISGRSDDNQATIRKRIEVFLSETNEIIHKIEQCRECQVLKVNSDREVNEVRAEVERTFLKLGYKPIGKLTIQL